MKLDDIDKAILEILQEDSKMGIKEIAFQVGLTTTPTYERIKRLERSNVIEGYTVKLNRKELGKNLQVFCHVSLKEHSSELIEVFEEKIVALPQVSQCYHIAGDHDYALLIEVSDMGEYESFLKHQISAIPYISNVRSSFVMSALKE
jgi:DNA-binding Lrp family transcriptional regulator